MSKKTEKKELKPVVRKKNFTFEYTFTEPELKEKSKQLAEACSERTHIDNERKSVASGYKSKLDSKEAEISILSHHISNGKEFLTKTCDCYYLFDEGLKIFKFDN